MTEFLAAFLLGLGLIMAIGPQNAFVIRQGLRREHGLLAAVMCALNDTVLISLGVLGVGRLLAGYPELVTLGTLAGITFLGWYGAQALMSARQAQTPQLGEGAQGRVQPGAIVMRALGFSVLNPHALLDTFVLMGGASASAAQPLTFLAGALTASWVWFLVLAGASRLLAGQMRSARMWQAVDLLVAVMMWGIALRLALGLLGEGSR